MRDKNGFEKRYELAEQVFGGFAFVFVCLFFGFFFYFFGFFWSFCLFIYLFIFLAFSDLMLLHLWHMEVPRLGVQLELQMPAYTTATATWDPSCVCDLHHSSPQRWILNPLSKARDWTHNLMIPSLMRFRWAMKGTPLFCFLFVFNHPTPNWEEGKI